jgi:hypothetical protein
MWENANIFRLNLLPYWFIYFFILPHWTQICSYDSYLKLLYTHDSDVLKIHSNDYVVKQQFVSYN